MREALASLRARMLALIAVPFAVILAMTVYDNVGDRADRLASARLHVLNTARLMAGDQRRLIDHVHQVLLQLALAPEVRGSVASEACNRALALGLDNEPSLSNLSLALPNGELICSAVPTAQSVKLADRAYFKSALESRGLSVGGYIVDRVTQQAVLPLGLSIPDETGAARSVLVASINLAWLAQGLARARLPEGSRVVVVDGAGLVLATSPDNDKWVGRSAAELSVWKGIRAEDGEGVVEDTGLAGTRRIFGFVPFHASASSHAYLWVSIPERVFVAPAEHAFIASMTVQLGLLVLTFAAVWIGSEALFVRRVTALAKAARDLGDGNLAARAGFEAKGDEIGHLAQSFDTMAASLQTKTEQLGRAVHGLRVLSAGNRAMLRAREGEQLLIESLCRGIVEANGYRNVWVGYAESDAARTIRPAAQWAVAHEARLEGLEFSWSETEKGYTPLGHAVRTGKPAVAHDIQREPGPQAWRDAARRCGFASCIAFPLLIEGRVIGVLTIFAETANVFSDDTVRLLGESASDLSFGIAAQREALAHERTKRALKTAEERYKAAAEANLDALFIAKCVRDERGEPVDFECTDANAHAAELLGMAREEIIGRKLCELLPIKDSGGFFGKYVRVVATGEPLEQEFPARIPQSEARWLRQQVVRVGDGIAIFARDITLWKEAEDRLLESEERLRLATTAAHMGAWTWDLKDDKFSFSDGIGPVFGLPHGDGFRTPEALLEATHPADREMLASAIAQSRELGAPINVEFRTVWPDGSPHWVEARSEFARGASGAVERGVGVMMDITQRKAGELALLYANRALRTLSACDQALVHANTEAELLETLCRTAVKIGGYRSAWVGYREQDIARTVRPVAHFSLEHDYLSEMKFSWADAAPGPGPVGAAIRTGTMQIVRDVRTETGAPQSRAAAQARGYRSTIAFPLKGSADKRIFGAFVVHAAEPDAFDEAEVKLLSELAEDLAFGIETLRTRAERDRMNIAQQNFDATLRKSLEESIQAVSNTLEMRDPYTAGHQKRVAQLAVAIADALGLPAEEIHGIRLAASIHDLGKIQVPAEILAKPGRLSEIEFSLIKTHPRAAHDILKGIEFPWPIADMVLQHHERLDGSGYPQGLKGDQILGGARILAVADVVEAMASHRPYRAAKGIELALAEIERGRGSTYDPVVVDACLKLFREQGFDFKV